MSSAESCLGALVDRLADGVAPEPVVVDDGDVDRSQLSGTVVRPLSLDRVGRSRRGGAILDLEMVVEVSTHGPHALALLERHLVTLEQTQVAQARTTVSPDLAAASGAAASGAAPSGAAAAAGATGMRIVVVVPVSVPLAEPQPPIVTRPPVVSVHFVSQLDGLVVDGEGHPVAGAAVLMAATGVTSVTDPGGRFRLLTTRDGSGPVEIEVTVRGRRHRTQVETPRAGDLASGPVVVVIDRRDDGHEPDGDGVDAAASSGLPVRTSQDRDGAAPQPN